MFRDEAVMIASAGKGGGGCRSFHREKYVNMGGPDGGDGGRGGDVEMIADGQENSLFRVSRNYHARAGDGQPGGGNNRTGKSGEKLVISVPVGTQVFDFERGNLLADLDVDGAKVVVCAGGKAGRGNARFATSVNQAPERAEDGMDGESRKLRLELKLVADVGLLGLPNAGKSTFIRRVTAARPRVAEYPFTTLDPSLGILDFGDLERQIVIADIPGLIEGAHEGKGLGHQFLRHVERTRVLLHLVDCSSMSSDPPEEAYRVIRGELDGYSAELASRPTMVVATKVEDEESAQIAKDFFVEIGHPERCISSATGKGLEQMLKSLQSLVAEGEEA
ncbi:MAG: GTPase ObgE [Planctomycetes bacterium]|nr:GTPase ObgE [Planctomycetota bacterium]MCP4770728.1 GTPase ObgE [Planctomycetota bacterium]MCP4861443.1 GTPase ObgE [Planctomycetota bacterium]